MSTQKDTASYGAFHELIDVLRETADTWLAPERGVESTTDVVEGLRNVLIYQGRHKEAQNVNLLQS